MLTSQILSAICLYKLGIIRISARGVNPKIIVIKRVNNIFYPVYFNFMTGIIQKFPLYQLRLLICTITFCGAFINFCSSVFIKFQIVIFSATGIGAVYIGFSRYLISWCILLAARYRQ